jgi:hypothetical protein
MGAILNTLTWIVTHELLDLIHRRVLEHEKAAVDGIDQGTSVAEQASFLHRLRNKHKRLNKQGSA